MRTWLSKTKFKAWVNTKDLKETCQYPLNVWLTETEGTPHIVLEYIVIRKKSHFLVPPWVTKFQQSVRDKVITYQECLDIL